MTPDELSQYYGNLAPKREEYMNLGELGFSSVSLAVNKLKESGINNPDWYFIEVNNALTEDREFIRKLLMNLEDFAKKRFYVVGGDFSTWSLLAIDKRTCPLCIRNRLI